MISSVGQLGDTLRERRVTLGISIEQAESATRIRARLLAALEEGDYDRLPNAGYVRGYVSSYARFLELDPLPLLAMYKAETGAGRFHELNLPQIDEAVVPTGQQHAVPWRAAVAVVLVVALVSLSIWAVTRIFRGPEPLRPEPAAVTTSSVEPAQTDETTAPAKVTPAPKPAVEVQPFTLKVSVASDGASWLEITVDGKQAYAGTLTGGQSKEFEVAETATVLIGKPSVVTVYRDGEQVDIPNSGGTPKVTLKAQPAEQ